MKETEKSVVVYRSSDGTIQLEVQLVDDNVWLTQAQISELFQKDISVISRHIKNIYKEGELDEESNLHFLQIPFSDKPSRLYDLVEGIFYDGQIFDAYNFISDLIRKAKKEIILIDNYIDDSVLKILNKRGNGVTAKIYTSKISDNLKLDLAKHNSQYPPINIEVLNKFHDRFLIIDDDLYHIGVSFKDLGKSVFAFSKLGIGKEIILSIL